MDTFFLEVINYFSYRLQGVIRFKHVIKQIEIYSKPYYSFREDLYYLINFRVSFQGEYKKQLTEKDLAEIERLLRMSETMSEYDYTSIKRNLNSAGGNFISNKPNGEFVGFLICDRENENGPYSKWQYLKRLKDFSCQYNTLCLFATHFVSQLAPDIKLLIHSLDEHPEFNCFKKFWNDINMPKEVYNVICSTMYDKDVNQYLWLQREQKNAESFVDTFTITDFEIFESIKLHKNDIREFIIINHIPFTLEGGKTIEKVVIDVYALKNALQGILVENRSSLEAELLKFIDGKINYQEYLLSKNKQKIKQLPFKVNDVIFLKKNIIAQVSAINFDKGKYNCTYRLINKDIHVGQREGQCNPVEEVVKFLKADLFDSLKQKYNWKHYRQLEGYMQNKLKSIDWNYFNNENNTEF